MGVLGGDFYDAVQTGPQRVSVLVGDVCGHAAEEAALGVELRVAWRALTLAGVDEERLLRTLERILVSERRAEEIFATLATVTRRRWRPNTARVRTAGHPPPILITGSRRAAAHGGAVDRARACCPGAPNKATEIALPHGRWDILVYTDGLIEARERRRLGRHRRALPHDRRVTWRGGGGSDGLPKYLVAEAERSQRRAARRRRGDAAAQWRQPAVVTK